MAAFSQPGHAASSHWTYSYLYTLRSFYCLKSGLPIPHWAADFLRLTAGHYVYRFYNVFHGVSHPFSLFISFSILSSIILVFAVKLGF